MYFQLLYIHLFRPFLNYNQSTSPLPAHVSPRKLCTQAAQMISKLLRLYKRSHGLQQICNIAVYIAHSACTIHLLNLPDKNAKRDIIHGCKHLEEIAESWLSARRTLGTLNNLSRKWKVELPEEAAMVLARAEAKFGPYTSKNSEAITPSTAGPTPAVQEEEEEEEEATANVGSSKLMVGTVHGDISDMDLPLDNGYHNGDINPSSSNLDATPNALEDSHLSAPASNIGSAGQNALDQGSWDQFMGWTDPSTAVALPQTFFKNETDTMVWLQRWGQHHGPSCGDFQDWTSYSRQAGW